MERRRKLLLAHLFAAPLGRDTAPGEENEHGGIVFIKQRNYDEERSMIISALAKADRKIEFLSTFADGKNFLRNLTGCRVLHFTWNGDGDQNKVMFENETGLAAPAKEGWLRSTCATDTAQLPELVVLTAASAKIVAGMFISAGIPNVVAVETSDDEDVTLGFVHALYLNLALGFTLRDSFETGLKSLPDGEEERCVLLPSNGNHQVAPFDDAESGYFVNRNPRSAGKMFKMPRVSTYPGREIQVQQVYSYMAQGIKVVTISGRPGKGKTQVALRACDYAAERGLFVETFFVPLQDEHIGKPIPTLKSLAAKIAHKFGISDEEIRRHTDGFWGCIQAKCRSKKGNLLLVLDGCSPYYVGQQKDDEIKLSSVVEQFYQRCPKLKCMVTVVTQVGIAKEKVVNVGKLSQLAAAELFVNDAPRKLTVQELRGGMVVREPQTETAGCMRLFSTGVIMTALECHPGAIIAARNKLKDWNLLTDEEDYLLYIKEQLQRYDAVGEEFARRLSSCRQSQSDNSASDAALEREWGRQPHPLGLPPAPSGPSDGEIWWDRAFASEKREGRFGEVSDKTRISWGALCKHSLAAFFEETLGEEARHRPLKEEDFQALGSNRSLWSPYPPPGSPPSAMANQRDFLARFWPWFRDATRLLKRTRCWGYQRYPVICGLTTSRDDGTNLLRKRATGTFLLRLSSEQGALALMHVKPNNQLGNVLIKASPTSENRFEMKVEVAGTSQDKTKSATLKELIMTTKNLTHLFPDTAKWEALSGVQ